jgi:hypothetical protein
VNRRGFLSLLGGTAVTATDPERLLWEPFKKLISIPRYRMPELRQFGVDIKLENLLSLYADDFERRYIDPAVMILMNRIDHDTAIELSRWRPTPMVLPYGLDKAEIRTSHAKHPYRLISGYHIMRGGFVARVDAMGHV